MSNLKKGQSYQRVEKKKPTSYQLDIDLQEPVEAWLSKNNMKMSNLVNFAIRDYITKEHALTPVTIRKISPEEYEDARSKMMKKHKNILDNLK